MLFKNQTISTHSSKNVMLASFVLIGTITFYNWFVAPHRGYLLAAQQYKSVVSDLAKKNRTIDNTMIIKKNKLKKLQEELERTHTKLFDTIEASEFFSSLQALVENANCTVSSLKFSPIKDGRSEKNKYIIAQRAKLSVIGSYSNITLLMNKLQDRSEQVQIGAVTIKPNRKNSDLLKCDMNITIYVIKNKEAYVHD